MGRSPAASEARLVRTVIAGHAIDGHAIDGHAIDGAIDGHAIDGAIDGHAIDGAVDGAVERRPFAEGERQIHAFYIMECDDIVAATHWANQTAHLGLRRGPGVTAVLN